MRTNTRKCPSTLWSANILGIARRQRFSDCEAFSQVAAKFVVIEAQASGLVEEVVARRAQWHAHVAELAAAPQLLRLTLDYHE